MASRAHDVTFGVEMRRWDAWMEYKCIDGVIKVRSEVLGLVKELHSIA